MQPIAEKKGSARGTKTAAAKDKSDKYYKQFDFFFNRSVFRTMTEFFKEKFNKYFAEYLLDLKKKDQKAWQQRQKQGALASITKEEMDALIERFLENTFGAQILSNPQLDKKSRQQMVNSMLMIVFSHRYTKGDKFLLEAQADSENKIDFTIVRDVMYKYSKKAQDRFFSFPIEAFFFATFALSDEGTQFMQSKPDNRSDLSKMMHLESDLSKLKNQAVESLQA